jgi:hypothetical protein
VRYRARSLRVQIHPEPALKDVKSRLRFDTMYVVLIISLNLQYWSDRSDNVVGNGQSILFVPIGARCITFFFFDSMGVS